MLLQRWLLLPLSLLLLLLQWLLCVLQLAWRCPARRSVLSCLPAAPHLHALLAWCVRVIRRCNCSAHSCPPHPPQRKHFWAYLPSHTYGVAVIILGSSAIAVCYNLVRVW